MPLGQLQLASFSGVRRIACERIRTSFVGFKHFECSIHTSKTKLEVFWCLSAVIVH